MTSDLKKCGDPYGTRTQLSSRKPVENTGFFQSVVFLVVFLMGRSSRPFDVMCQRGSAAQLHGRIAVRGISLKYSDFPGSAGALNIINAVQFIYGRNNRLGYCASIHTPHHKRHGIVNLLPCLVECSNAGFGVNVGVYHKRTAAARMLPRLKPWGLMSGTAVAGSFTGWVTCWGSASA